MSKSTPAEGCMIWSVEVGNEERLRENLSEPGDFKLGFSGAFIYSIGSVGLGAG